ncbi:hypothetical protein P691DRAFT_778919 [Macrolepiota fuliginosa MF-IS2]|uniref:Uncharacterized protein n=1 Tax=Macrolepiota fuliginosa MF-IS2 TaxID=1400762 RepID=A0A9P6BZF2_9AGAR|nr:hypothetical protein P691DRAFT_778919 [Macrolepiota fuliginosa MF-IS2]
MRYTFPNSKIEHQFIVADVHPTSQRDKLAQVVLERTAPKALDATLPVHESWRYTPENLNGSLPVRDSISLWGREAHHTRARVVQVLDIPEGYPFYRFILGISHLHFALGPYKLNGANCHDMTQGIIHWMSMELSNRTIVHFRDRSSSKQRDDSPYNCEIVPEVGCCLGIPSIQGYTKDKGWLEDNITKPVQCDLDKFEQADRKRFPYLADKKEHPWIKDKRATV